MKCQIAKYGAKKTFYLMEPALFIFRLTVLLCRLVKHQTKSSWLGNCQQSPLFCCIALFYHCPNVGPMHLECHMCLLKGQVHTFSHTILTTKLREPFKHSFYIFLSNIFAESVHSPKPNYKLLVVSCGSE